MSVRFASCLIIFFAVPYLPMMLCGLVHAPPDYVLASLAGEPLGEPPAENIARLVLVRADHHP